MEHVVARVRPNPLDVYFIRLLSRKEYSSTYRLLRWSRRKSVLLHGEDSRHNHLDILIYGWFAYTVLVMVAHRPIFFLVGLLTLPFAAWYVAYDLIKLLMGGR